MIEKVIIYLLIIIYLVKLFLKKVVEIIGKQDIQKEEVQVQVHIII